MVESQKGRRARKRPSDPPFDLIFLDVGRLKLHLLASGSGMLGRCWASVNTGAFRFSGEHLSSPAIEQPGRAALEFRLHNGVRLIELSRIAARAHSPL
jgi:hypothetical protein